MMAVDTPDIVVGRVLSAYSIDDVQNGDVRVTYTVYNQEAEEVSGVLLTSTLQPGVSFTTASQLPDQNGQELAWSLGTIPAYGRTSVEMTVHLADNSVLTIDDGAEAFSTLNARASSDVAPAAVLKDTPLPAALLASTVDANTTDPFIQEQAARLDYDPQRIIDFLQDDVGYESYVGSLRGSRGTLWSSAGNALDEASLGVALFRASGIPAQYASGTLSDPLAQQLILSMFPDSFQTVGYIPAGTQLSDPANDPQLLSETRRHYWIQFDVAGSLQDIDTTFENSTIGQTFAATTGTFSEVADNLRHKVQVQLNVETYSQASAAFGLGGGISSTDVLNVTFSSAELVGRPLTLGHQVDTSNIASPIISAVTTTYYPYLLLGDEAFAIGDEALLRGSDYQEVKTNLPFGNQLLTGLFLRLSTRAPDGQAEMVERALLDRIGFAARSGLVNTTVSVDPNAPSPISPIDTHTISVLSGDRPVSSQYAPGLQGSAIYEFTDYAATLQGATGVNRDGLINEGISRLRDLLITGVRSRLADFETQATIANQASAELLRVRTYLAEPRLSIGSSKLTVDDQGNSLVELGIDLRKSEYRVIADPGQTLAAQIGFNTTRGFTEAAIEDAVLAQIAAQGSSVVTPISVVAIFGEAARQNIEVLELQPADISRIDQLPFSADVRARLATALNLGKSVAIPAELVDFAGDGQIGWYEYDQATGNTVSVLADGTHGALAEFGAVLSQLAEDIQTAEFWFGYITGLVGTKFLDVAIFLVKIAVTPTVNANGVFSSLSLAKNVINTGRNLLACPGLPGSAFCSGYYLGVLSSFVWLADPELPETLFSAQPDRPFRSNRAAGSLAVTSSVAGGSVAGNVTLQQADLQGDLQATYTTNEITTYGITSLQAASAVVRDSQGVIVGTGNVLIAEDQVRAATVAGNVAHDLLGRGQVAFYAPATSNLGFAGTWEQYTVKLTGSATIQLATAGLSLNGTLLAPGVYSITTSAAALAGNGNLASSSFSGSAAWAVAGALRLGPALGALSVAGVAQALEQGVSFADFNGQVVVVPSGGADNLMISGSTTDLLRIAVPALVAADQNTPATITPVVSSSLGGAYDMAVVAPEGWRISLQPSGQITVQPAAGAVAGQYTVRIVIRSKVLPELIAAADLLVDVTAAAPGLVLDVLADSVYTVPFQGAQVPTSFRATLQNLGPVEDTYDLTFPNPPAGFTILRSTDSLTVPAGETGISGIYLEPNGVLPAPGTSISFTVTATSRTNPLITQTETFTFAMPDVAAVTVDANPVKVSTTPGAPVTANVVIRNVGNLPYNLAIGASLPNGLTVSGLTTPVALAVGQTTTQTVTLTAAANTLLNSTLTPTFTYGPAVAANQAAVVQVNTSDSHVEVGQTLTVSADVFAAVLQAQQGSVVFVVKNSLGAVVQTGAATPLALGVVAATKTINLGSINTVALAAGEYTIEVTARDSSNVALPGAVGIGQFVVGLPVSATQDVTPNTVNEGLELAYVTGNATVESSVQVGQQPLVSLIDTNGTALNIALSGNLAYVAGTKAVTIVDLSNPASPQNVGSFGAAQLSQDAFNVAQIVGNSLVIGSTSTVNSEVTNIIVYSLANPLSPQHVGTTSVPYRFISDLLVQGTTAVVPTGGISFALPGTIINQFGDVVALNLAATPAVADVLFNTNGSPNGGTTRQSGGTIVNSGLAYIGSSTFTGNNTTTGNGRVLAVNIANPANLSVAAEVEIPGMQQVLDIAIDGNRALVVGSTGSIRNPFNGFNDLGLEGTLALAVLDITNPNSPVVIGATKITEAIFPSGTAPSLLQAVSLGNGQFAVSGVKIPQQGPAIVVVDATNAADIQTSNLSTPALVNGLSGSGQFLHASSAAGLATYRIAAIVPTAVHVEVQIPNATGVTVDTGSFNVAPTQTIVGPGFDTLVWDLTLNAAQPTQELSWNTNITGMIPGTTKSVTLGTTIDAVSSSGTTNLSLADQVVAATPAAQTLQIPVRVAVPGADAIARASVTATRTGRTDLGNRMGDLSSSLTTLVQNPTDAVARSQSLATLTAIRVLLDSECCLQNLNDDLLAAQNALAAAAGPIQIQAAVIDVGDVIDQLAARLDDLLRHEYQLDLVVNQFIVQPDVPARFDLFLRNLGTQTTTYDFVLNGLPPTATAIFDQTSITLAPGEFIGAGGAVQDVFFTITQSGLSLAAFGFTLTAIPREAPLLVCPTDGSLALRDEFIGVASVALGTNFTQPGPTVPVTANLLSSVNSPTPVSVLYQLTNAADQVVFTSTEVAANLTVAAPLVSVNLPGLDTSALADGAYSVVTLVKDQLGVLIPGATATATVLIGTPLSANLTVSDRVGLNAEFFDFTTSLSVIPNFTGLTPDVVRLDRQVNYANTSGSFAGLDSRFVDTFAARHTGVIKIPTAGSYTFYLSSDDGSRLYLDGVQVIGNDGVHAQNEVSATRTLTAGFHDVRIEYFENFSDAALIFSWAGPGIGKQVVPESVLFTQPTTPGSSVTLAPGTRIVSNSLTIESQTAFTDPLTFRGLVDTPAIGTSVAVLGNIAYVAGTEDVSIVDISVPTSPSIVGSFASSQIVSGGVNLIEVQGNRLIVGATTTLNASIFSLFIYDITNPLTPSLVGSTNVNYIFMSDLAISGNTVLVPTNGYSFFSGGSIFDQFGDFVSVDITNSTAPAFSDALFNNRDSTLGSDNNQNNVAVVNSNLAYVVGTTSTGGDTQAGNGRLLLVNTSNPSDLALLDQIQIPGTVHAVNIAIDGNRALVTGSTGGWRDNFGSLDNSGLTGNVTLTQLDISDPLHPVVLGTTHLVQGTTYPAQGLGGRRVDTIALGNGLYAVSGILKDGAPALLIFDPTDPNNLVVSTSVLPNLVNGMAVSGNRLYTSSATGLAIYDIGQLQNIPLTATVKIPNGTGVSIVPGSFNTPPSQIIPGPAFDTLVWNRNLAFGNDQFNFTWQSTVTNLAPGEVRVVTHGAEIDSELTLTLPETTARALPAARLTLGLTPPVQTLQPGAATDFIVTVNNPNSTAGTFSLSTAGIPDEWGTLPASVQVPANGSVQVPLQITSDIFAQLGDQGFTVVAVNGTQQGFVQGTLTFVGPAQAVDPESHGIFASIVPNLVTTGQGQPGAFTVRLTNTGSATDTFNLMAALPPGFTAMFEQTSVEIPPGASNFREITVLVTPPAGTIAAVYPFTVTATSATLAEIASAAIANLSVVVAGVDASLSPSAAPAGTTFQLTVRNTGSTTDTFDLALAGPAALVSTLAQSSVTLAPGASQVINVNVAAIDFAVPGSLELAAIATSRNNNAVQDLASADVTIPFTFAVDSAFEEDTITLAAPGTGTFLLLVDNLGNGEDAYEATIIATSGPLTATLIGLDGSAVQTVPIFRLPGLSTGAIVLNANLADVGSGTITVQVRSLTNDTIVSQSVATLRSTITDFGDAPDTYGTTLARDGARHLAIGPQLGLIRDPEIDATATTTALGDDMTGDVDDEDGVVLPGLFVAGTCDCSGTGLGNQIIVNATGPGFLDAWVDFNRDGDFDASERIASSFPVHAGTNTLVPAIPTTVSAGPSFARFRLSSTGGLGPMGAAADGEVEDHAVQLFNPTFGSAGIIADPLSVNGRVLYVKGTESVDAIVVRQTSPTMVTVYVAPTLSIGSFALNSFDRIVICGLGAPDAIVVEAPIIKPTVIYGDEGNDSISGGSGPDIIFGGEGYDAIVGNLGDDTISGGSTSDSLVGGLGFDTFIGSGSGSVSLSNTQFRSGNNFQALGFFELATITGGAASDTFDFTGWSFPVTVDGGAGVNSIVDGGDANYTLTETALIRASAGGTRTIGLTNIRNAALTGGFGNNSFNLTAWPHPAALKGEFGTDTFSVTGDAEYTLTDTMLLRPGLGLIRLDGLEHANLTGGEADNIFNILSWSKTATINGADGNDKLASSGNVNFTLTNTSLTRTTGGAIGLASIEEAELTGGAGNNTLSATAFSGNVKLDGSAGNDTLQSGPGIALLLGGLGNDVLTAGGGPAVLIGGAGLDRLTGEASDDLLISGQTAHDANAAALAAILAEWTSASSYADRRAHLTGTAGGLNNGKNLHGGNVTHDTAIDILFGGLGNDLFFAKLTSPGADLTDAVPTESAL